MEIDIGISECDKNVDNYYGRNIESLRRPGGFRQCRAPSWFHDKNLFMESSLMLAGMEASNTPHVLSPFLYPCR